MSQRGRPNYQGIGAPLRRVEDKRFLTGHGRFVADIELSGALDCALVRSPHAHAAIRRIDAAAARAAPGVVAVFTGADMAGGGAGPMRPPWGGPPSAKPLRGPRTGLGPSRWTPPPSPPSPPRARRKPRLRRSCMPAPEAT